jgi:hypothetical protein
MEAHGNGKMKEMAKWIENPSINQLSPSAALQLLLNLNISRENYQYLRSNALDNNSNFYPSYKRVQAEKKFSYPEGITFNQSCASVPWLSLIQHTAQRTIDAFPSVFEDKCKDLQLGSMLIATVGLGEDGSSNHMLLNQKLDSNADDSHLFAIVMTFLALSTEDGSIIYVNPLPQSTHSVRAQKLIAQKETVELLKSEYDMMMAEIKEIEPFPVTMPSGD